jgi:hypothetical protein
MKHRTGLPPMPWSTVNHMSRDDLMAIHAYLSALGPGGHSDHVGCDHRRNNEPDKRVDRHFPPLS